MVMCAFGQAALVGHGAAGRSWAASERAREQRGRRAGSACVGGGRRRQIVRAGSLEESKRRAKSQYDNIADLNQQYLAELNWVERKYGAQRATKDAAKEAERGILRSDKARGRAAAVAAPEARGGEAAPGDGGLGQYEALRRRLLGDTLLVGALGLCAAWTVGGVRDVFSFGAGLGAALAYVTLLARSVDRLGESARASGRAAGDGLQPARVAIVALLVLASARGARPLSLPPALLGFFSYKVAAVLPLLTGEAFE